MAKAYEGKIEQLDDYRWRIPKESRPDMRVDGVIYASKASTAAVIAIVIAAAALVMMGTLLFRRGGRPPTRAAGVGLILAPLTGVAPVLAVWVLGVLSKAISWGG